MSFQVYYEDGRGNIVDEFGNEPIGMEVDDELYPLDNVTELDFYTDIKPPERKAKTRAEDHKESPVTNLKVTERSYKIHGDVTKEQFFYLVYEKDMTPGKAGKQLGIARSTAYNWFKRDQENPQEEIMLRENQKKNGRRAILNEEHQKSLEEQFLDNPSATLNQAMESLTNQFTDLKVSKTTVYTFMKEKCALSFKKAHLLSKERNSPTNIKKRYNWVVKWGQTDLDFESKCVFVDESAFHINLKRTMAWSKKGTRAEVVQPTTRAKTTTILGAIAPYGVVNVKVRRPMASSKKRKLGGVKAAQTTGTVTGHYFGFIASTLDVLDKHEQFKGHYIVMDNAPIHTSESIEKLIVSRGYGCVYLPPYSPELNPIEQFWSVVKSKLKREKLLEDETLTTRISEACNKVLFSELQGFCRYSASRFDDCLNKKNL